MSAYFNIPAAFRQSLFQEFGDCVRRMISASRHLELLDGFGADSKDDSEFAHQTIFSFVPHRQGAALDIEQCLRLYRAMGEDVTRLLPPGADDKDRRIASRLCQIGQPVTLHHRPGAVLRLSASARLASRCWLRGAATVREALAPEQADLAVLVEKLDWLIDHPAILDHS
jgi:hypothetical protein